MSDPVLVRSGNTEFYVTVREGSGPQKVGLDDAFSFDGVRDTVDTIASHLAEVWKKVGPDEATVEFGLTLTAKSGKLTGLLVEGEGNASLNITLTWKNSPAG